MKENTDVPQTLPIMICTYPGVPYKIARLIHNWAPLIKLDQGWRIVKSETRRDAEILVRNPSPRLFGEKFRDSKKVKTNHAKTRLRDLSKTFPRFRDLAKIFRDPRFSRYQVWRPSGVEHFLSNTKLEGCSDQPDPSSLTSSNLERCNTNSYLTTKESLSCPSCTEPVFLRGQHPRNVPLNVIYREHKNFLEVAYWTFFPYNRGKRVCFGYVQKGCFLLGRIWGRCPCGENLGCIGEYSTFGHHVGDWERITVRFRKVNNDYQIYSIHLSIHGIDVTNKFGGEFLWQDGQFKRRDQTIAMYGGTHAVIYSSEGSHGMWPSAGRHEYKVLPNGETLVDYTSSGLSWYTWERLKPVQYDPIGQYSGEFKFLGFKGRWGNRKRGCGIVGIVIGECQLNNGPKEPSNSFPNYQIDNMLSAEL